MRAQHTDASLPSREGGRCRKACTTFLHRGLATCHTWMHEPSSSSCCLQDAIPCFVTSACMVPATCLAPLALAMPPVPPWGDPSKSALFLASLTGLTCLHAALDAARPAPGPPAQHLVRCGERQRLGPATPKVRAPTASRRRKGRGARAALNRRGRWVGAQKSRPHRVNTQASQRNNSLHCRQRSACLVSA